MKCQTALFGVKQAFLSPESDPWRHAAVRPLADHEATLAEHQVRRLGGRDFSRVPAHASEPDGGHAEVSCPLTPRRCPLGGACHKCPVQVQARRLDGREQEDITQVPPIVHEVLRSPGQPLDPATRANMEPRFGHDSGSVRVHTDAKAAESARAVNALAYTVGRDVVFGTRQYAPDTTEGKRLIAHEMVHVMQQAGGNASPAIQRRAAPYIKKVTVHLTPPQSADLEWQGTTPADAVGSDHFTVSTGKGYSDPDDPPGTCTRTCCSDPMKQCAPPWNQPGRVGACCTYYGSNFWTGAPLVEHNGCKWWTPIQPYYSQRGIALHQHDEVTGRPIGHGCVRMAEANAKRIYDYSNGRRTNVTMDGRAAPVACDAARRCPGSEGKSSAAETVPPRAERLAEAHAAIPGLEGVLT